MIITSAEIGGVFGAISGAAYLLFLPALIIIVSWANGDSSNWLVDLKFVPYLVVACMVLGGATGAIWKRHTAHDCSLRVGLIILGAMLGAGVGTGPFLAIYFPVPLLAAFIGANVGYLLGAVFGCTVAAIGRVTGTTWEEQLRHCLRLRVLAIAIPAAGFIAIYLMIHAHTGVAPSQSLTVDYLVVPVLIATISALPVLLFGSWTRRFY